MYTQFDKALVGLIMAVLALIAIFYKPINISSDTIATIVSVLTPVLVYLVPNLPKDPTA